MLWAGRPLPALWQQENPGARRVFSCTGRQSRPLFSAPAADSAVLADKGGYRHLVAATGRGAHSFAGAWGQERRQRRELGSLVAVGPHPAGVMAESRRLAPCPLPARPAESHAPQEGAVQRAELSFCSRGDSARRRSACGAPGISTLATHSGSNLRPEPQPCIPFPFLKLKTTSGIQHQALDHPQQPRPQDHESGNRIPTRALNPRPQTRSRIRDPALNPEPIPDLALNPGPPPRLPHLRSRRGPAPRMRP